MTEEEFEQLVNEGVEAIPKKFLDLLDNVAVTIADEPTYAQLAKFNLVHGGTLFGLYEGVPQNKRGVNYTSVLPDKITIFRKPIELASGNNPDIVKQIVKNTVWHEIAHHFGMDEGQVRNAEHKRRQAGK
ncbi:MAG: metallopeptidase family protein [Candidatus Doudnabacteria bacterium]